MWLKFNYKNEYLYISDPQPTYNQIFAKIIEVASTATVFLIGKVYFNLDFWRKFYLVNLNIILDGNV